MRPPAGSSSGVCMFGDRLFAVLFEFARDLRPRVVRLDQATAGLTQEPAPLGVANERYDGTSKILRIVGRHEMLAWNDRESFGADRRRDHRLAHREGFEDLQPC